MQQDILTVGVELAKNVFQGQAIDADGKVLFGRQLRRAEVLKFFSALPRCLVGMETSVIGPSLGPRACRQLM